MNCLISLAAFWRVALKAVMLNKRALQRRLAKRNSGRAEFAVYADRDASRRTLCAFLL